LTDEQRAEAMKNAEIARDSIVYLYETCEELIEALKREHERSVHMDTRLDHDDDDDCPVCQLIRRVEG